MSGTRLVVIFGYLGLLAMLLGGAAWLLFRTSETLERNLNAQDPVRKRVEAPEPFSPFPYDRKGREIVILARNGTDGPAILWARGNLVAVTVEGTTAQRALMKRAAFEALLRSLLDEPRSNDLGTKGVQVTLNGEGESSQQRTMTSRRFAALVAIALEGARINVHLPRSVIVRATPTEAVESSREWPFHAFKPEAAEGPGHTLDGDSAKHAWKVLLEAPTCRLGDRYWTVRAVAQPR